MKTIKGLHYTKDHEWVKVDGTKAYVGVTDYAQDALGDIVFVELPEVDDEAVKGDEICVVESVKAASDIYSPVSGTVVEVNEGLEDDPAAINSAPYEQHIYVVELSDQGELDGLMNNEEYEKYCSDQISRLHLEERGILCINTFLIPIKISRRCLTLLV